MTFRIMDTLKKDECPNIRKTDIGTLGQLGCALGSGVIACYVPPLHLQDTPPLQGTWGRYSPWPSWEHAYAHAAIRARMVMPMAPIVVIRAMREQGSNAQQGAYDQEHAYLFSVLKHLFLLGKNPKWIPLAVPRVNATASVDHGHSLLMDAVDLCA